MKNNRASRPSGVTSDLLKKAGKTGLRTLTRIFQGIFRDEKCPKEWQESITVA